MVVNAVIKDIRILIENKRYTEARYNIYKLHQLGYKDIVMELIEELEYQENFNPIII